MRNNPKTMRLVAASIALCLAGAASADNLQVSPNSATGLLGGGTSPTPLEVVFTSDESGLVTNGFQADIAYDAATFDVALAAQNGATCTEPGGPDSGSIRVLAADLGGNALASNTYCNLTFTVDGAAVEDTYPLAISGFLVAQPGGAPNTDAHTTTDGEIVVTAAPPDVVLSFTPPSGGTVTFPGGTQGDTVSESIDITGGGSFGTGTVDNCDFTGANAGAFSVTQPISVDAGAAGTIDLDCVLDDVAQSATLTCDVEDSNGASQASWTMSCPAGTPTPSPEYSSNPAPDSTITCNGAPGATIARSITVENTGNPGAGEELDYSCSVADGTNFAIVGGASGTGLLVGDTATVQIECTAPAAAGDPANTDQINCTTNEAGTPTYNYGLSSSVVTAPPPVPQPNVVPAGSLWSKLLLIGLLAGLGGLIVAMRRQ